MNTEKKPVDALNELRRGPAYAGEGENMYSPKVSEDLVPVLYRMAKEKRMPMTRFVDRLIRQALTSSNPPAEMSVREDLPDGKDTAVNLASRFPVESELRKAVA